MNWCLQNLFTTLYYNSIPYSQNVILYERGTSSYIGCKGLPLTANFHSQSVENEFSFEIKCEDIRKVMCAVSFDDLYEKEVLDFLPLAELLIGKDLYRNVMFYDIHFDKVEFGKIIDNTIIYNNEQDKEIDIQKKLISNDGVAKFFFKFKEMSGNIVYI